MVDGKTYNLAVHTHEAFAFGNYVGPGYTKVEVTNDTRGASHLISPEELFAREDYDDAVSKSISKPGFFEARDRKFLNATK